MTFAEWYQGVDLETVAGDLGIDANTDIAELPAIAEDIADLCRVDRGVVLTDGVRFCADILAEKCRDEERTG